MQKYVYLMRSETDGEIKIGLSKDPAARAKYLSYAQHKVTLFWQLECSDAVKTERALHAKFWRSRTGGEYFTLTQDEIDWIMAQTEESICEGFDPDRNSTWSRGWLNFYKSRW